MALTGIGTEVEGLHAVAAAVSAGRVSSLYVESSRVDALGELFEAAAASGAAVEVVDDVSGLASTTAPQGVVARCRPIAAVGLKEAVESLRPAALLVLDHLEDGRNVGAAARSARAAGLGALVVSSRRAAPLGAVAFKSAAGALEHLPVAVVSSVANAAAELHRLGVWTVGLDAGADESLFGLELLAEPVAIFVGGEGRGLGRLVRDRVDVLASIPLAGGVESLNASVAASLAAYEVARVRSRSRA
jgi:23S rRNA (guanosine2251-2'-O)-methyltransferase